MQNLFWKKNTKMVPVAEVPFAAEEEFEKFIVEEAPVLFEDIYVFKRQVRANGNIPDLLGVDRDNNVVIIENKNKEVTEDILPQILRYAIWAEDNPDSIRALWLESKDRPDDIEIDWDKLEIRILILAPKILLSVAKHVKKLNYAVDLIEVKKYKDGQQNFVLINRLEGEELAVKKIARGLEVYDKAFYEKTHNANSVAKYLALADDLSAITKSRGWKVEKKVNKNYIGFKYGGSLVFGIHWWGSRTFGIFVKIPKVMFSKIKRIIPYPSEYNERWKNLEVKVDETFNPKKLIQAFQMGYEYIIGK